MGKFSFTLSHLNHLQVKISRNNSLWSSFCCSVAQLYLTVLWPHGLQHARLPCYSLSSGVCLNSCPSSQWCHPTISSSVITFSSCPQFFPASVFPNKSALCIRWPEYWSFSISPSNESSGIFRMCPSLHVLTVLAAWQWVPLREMGWAFLKADSPGM